MRNYIRCALAWLALATGCAEVQPPTISLQEELGGTCGGQDPISDIRDVCRDLGGVATEYENEGALELRCRQGLLTWARFDGEKGVFEMTTDDCSSQYILQTSEGSE